VQIPLIKGLTTTAEIDGDHPQEALKAIQVRVDGLKIVQSRERYLEFAGNARINS
jgi:hypothetical protein